MFTIPIISVLMMVITPILMLITAQEFAVTITLGKTVKSLIL